MNTLHLSPADYRFLAALPDNERQLFLELIRQLDARFTDTAGPGGRPRPCFLAELEERRT